MATRTFPHRFDFLKCLTVLIIFTGQASCLDRVPLNTLYKDDSIRDFYNYCTKDNMQKCELSSPEDFERLYRVKIWVRELIDFYTSIPRLVHKLCFLLVIFILMLHLAIVGHFDWRTLPIISLYYETDLAFKEKTLGVRYQQFIWMKYLVLRGVHRVFKDRNVLDINWYKHNKHGDDFDYTEVNIRRFTFLDKKNLTKHLDEDFDKDVSTLEFGNVHSHTHAHTRAPATVY